MSWEVKILVSWSLLVAETEKEKGEKETSSLAEHSTVLVVLPLALYSYWWARKCLGERGVGIVILRKGLSQRDAFRWSFLSNFLFLCFVRGEHRVPRHPETESQSQVSDGRKSNRCMW